MKHITLLLRGILRTHVVPLLIFTVAIIPILAVNRSGAAAAAAPTVRNVVLVHGAFADGSSWAKVIPLLEAKGLYVAAVQNPLSSLADDVATTKREPGTGKAARALSAAVLTTRDRGPFPWSNYRQGKCGLDK